MEYIGGTDKVIKLIKELEKSGDLINFYTEEYFSSVNSEYLNSRVFEDLVEHHGNEFIGHLLIGCFHENEDKFINLLREYGPTNEERRWAYTCDCFAFINLKTQSILYMGITARKRHYTEFIIGKERGNDDNFDHLDVLGIISDFRTVVEDDIAHNMNQLHYNGLTSNEYWEYALGANGLYHSEYDVEDIEEDSEEGLTKDELDNLIQAAESREKEIKNAESFLQTYFPKFSTENINE